MTDDKAEQITFYVGLIAALFWGFGTNLLDRRWYVIHGVSVGDLVFLGWIVWASARPSLMRQLVSAARSLVVPLGLMFLFAVWLLASVVVNVFRFGASWLDLFAILRLFYFSAIMVFCVAYVRRWGLRPLLTAFILGVVLLTVGRFVDVFASARPMVTSLPLLKDPNVVGNMLGVAVLMSSMLIFEGSIRWALALTAGFSMASAMTFSKGAWLMVLFGVVANVVAILMRTLRTRSGLRRTALTTAGFFLTFVVLGAYYAVPLGEVIEMKFHTTTVDDSMGLRFRYALGGLYAMIDNPLFGVGFRNYYVVETMYPELVLPASDNAHNVFSQVGAAGGLPAFVLFLMLFTYPFLHLWRVVRRGNTPLLAVAYVTSSAVVFFLSGAVQLQIFAQPFFWVFTGLVRDWHYNSSS
jgi:O-antigen ligase